MRSYQLGVNAFVVKPVGFKEFFEAIQDLGVFWAGAERAAAAQGGWPSNAVSAGPLHILLLEDSDLDAELLGAVLDDAGSPTGSTGS